MEPRKGTVLNESPTSEKKRQEMCECVCVCVFVCVKERDLIPDLYQVPVLCQTILGTEDTAALASEAHGLVGECATNKIK